MAKSVGIKTHRPHWATIGFELADEFVEVEWLLCADVK